MTDSDYPVHLSQREDGIIIFKFNRSDRVGADHFEKLVRASWGDLPSPLRIIYDLSACPPPTRYFLILQARLHDEAPLPEDMRSAYVFPHGDAQIWGRIMRRDFKHREEAKFFADFDQAVDWLLGA